MTLKNKIPPPFIMLFFGFMMWLTRHYDKITTSKSPDLTYLAFILVVVGVFLDIRSFLNFRKLKTTVNPLSPNKASNLVITGFYRYTRNPMYLGMFLLLLAWALLLQNYLSFLYLPIFVFTINQLQIKPEEIVLEKIFGDEYRKFKTKVRRWI